MHVGHRSSRQEQVEQLLVAVPEPPRETCLGVVHVLYNTLHGAKGWGVSRTLSLHAHRVSSTEYTKAMTPQSLSHTVDMDRIALSTASRPVQRSTSQPAGGAVGRSPLWGLEPGSAREDGEVAHLSRM